MAARIVLFGATGYTGRLAAEAMVERGLRPVLAARSPGQARRTRRGARRRARDSDGRRCRSADRARARGEGRRARDNRGTVRPLGCPGRCGGHHGRGALHRLDRRAALHPRGLRALRAGGRQGGHRDAHRVRLRLGAGQPGRRPRARARRRAGYARGRGLLHHRERWFDERRHEVIAHGRDLRAGLRTPRRPRPDRARRKAGAHLQGWFEAASGRVGGKLGALRAAARGAAPARGECLPRVVRTGFAGDAGHVRLYVGRDEGAGRGQALERGG